MNEGQSMQHLVGAWTRFGIYSQEQWAAIKSPLFPGLFPHLGMCLIHGSLVLCPLVPIQSHVWVSGWFLNPNTFLNARTLLNYLLGLSAGVSCWYRRRKYWKTTSSSFSKSFLLLYFPSWPAAAPQASHPPKMEMLESPWLPLFIYLLILRV